MSPTEIRRNIKAYAQLSDIQAVEDFDGRWSLIIDGDVLMDNLTADRALFLAKTMAD